MNLKKIAIAFASIFAVLLLISFVNNKRVEKTNENFETKENFNDAVVLQSSTDLEKLETSFRINSTIEQDINNYLIQSSHLLLNSLSEENDTSKKKLEIKNLSKEKILSFTHNIVTGGEKACFDKAFLIELIQSYFNVVISDIPKSQSYQIINDNICFENVFLNEVAISNTQIKNISDTQIEVLLTEEGKEKTWQFTYQYNGFHYTIEKIEWF